MAAARVERRLAAILAADVVGYSRLMERDEAGTLERLKLHRREIIDPLIAEHHGRVVKLMGDGALCEFASVVDAVACAVAIQRGMAEREANVPEGERIRFRIGINLGDVIHEEDGDLYGAHWWVEHDDLGTFTARGYEGQSIAICPALDLVVVRLGRTPEERKEAVARWRADVVAAFAR